MASSRGEYSFHAKCGSQAKISNRSRTAERMRPRSEFNNAVVMSAQPLADGKLFEVKIDGKVSTWTGSILIGWCTYACVEPEGLCLVVCRPY